MAARQLAPRLGIAGLAQRAAHGLDETLGDFGSGKVADFVYVRPGRGSALAATLDRVDDLEAMLGAVFTLADQASIREVRVEGTPVFQRAFERDGQDDGQDESQESTTA